MTIAICQLEIHYKIGPQPGMNVLHFFSEFFSEEEGPDEIAFDMIGSFVVNLESLWRDCLPEDVELLGYKGRRIRPTGGPTIVSLASGIFGTRSGNFSASSTGPCIIAGYQREDETWRTGRIFLPGVSEDDIEENKFSAGLIDALDDLYEELSVEQTGPVLALSWEYGIFSRVDETFSGAETLTTSGRPGTQRNRLKPSF